MSLSTRMTIRSSGLLTPIPVTHSVTGRGRDPATVTVLSTLRVPDFRNPVLVVVICGLSEGHTVLLDDAVRCMGGMEG